MPQISNYQMVKFTVEVGKISLSPNPNKGAEEKIDKSVEICALSVNLEYFDNSSFGDITGQK